MTDPLLITASVLEHLVLICKTAKAEDNAEAWGYLLAERGSNVITSVMPMRNTSDNPTVAYDFDQEEVLATHRWFDSQGLTDLAVYHSHLESPPLMSQADLDQAIDTTVAYLIVSLEAKPVARAYRVTRPFIGSVEHEQVEIQVRQADSTVTVPTWPWALAPGNNVRITYKGTNRTGNGGLGAGSTKTLEGVVSDCANEMLYIRPLGYNGSTARLPAVHLDRLLTVRVLRESDSAAQLRRECYAMARNLGNAFAAADMSLAGQLVNALKVAVPTSFSVEFEEI